MFSSVFYGILRETRTVLLYSIPVAVLMSGLKRYDLAFPLLMVFISSLAYIFVLIVEDRDSMDAKFKSLVARLCTAVGLYYSMKYVLHVIFENFNFEETLKEELFQLECIRLLREYVGFMESMSIVRIFFTSLMSTLYVIATIISRVIPI
jgi:hypothetical protein